MTRETYWGAQMVVALALVACALLKAPAYIWLGLIAAETFALMFRLRDSGRPGWLALAFPLLVIFPGPLAGMAASAMVRTPDMAGAEGQSLAFVLVGAAVGLSGALAMIAWLGALPSRAKPGMS